MKNRNTIFTAILFTLAVLCAAAAPKAFGVVPAPDGGYAGNNTAEGTQALQSLSGGIDNTALGFQVLFHNTTGNSNTAEGFRALFANTNGHQNTATGVNALLSNTTGNFNTATGVNALHDNIAGGNNTATGVQALFSNTSGNSNTATGVAALFSNTIGSDNTASGTFALLNNTEGSGNTAVGRDSLISNTAHNNTAIGRSALGTNNTGSSNTACGYSALLSNTSGTQNTAVGLSALSANSTGAGNTAIGVNALQRSTGGIVNIAVGASAGVNVTTGDFNIDIGHPGQADDTHTIRIGSANHTRSFIAGIRGVTTGIPDAINVVIDSAGQLGTISSSRRFKKEIKPMDKASEAILALKPVTFHYKSNATNIPQFGLIAEEVAEANPDLIVRDKNGEIYTVRYDAVNAMLLNEFLKEHKKVQNLEATVAQQQKGMEALTAEIRAQASQIQKVSAQVEMNKPTTKVVLNNP